MLCVCASHLLLVGLDRDPAEALGASVLTTLARFGDVFVFLILVGITAQEAADSGPDRVVAPTAATFDEKTGSVGVGDGEKRILVAESRGKKEAKAVVVNMQFTTLLRKALRIKVNSTNNDRTCDEVAGEAATCLEHMVGVAEQAEEGDSQKSKHGPQASAPSLHDLPVQGEVLHGANVHMREVDAKYDKSGRPKHKVPVEDFLVGVSVARLSLSECTAKIVRLLNRVEPQKVDAVIIMGRARSMESVVPVTVLARAQHVNMAVIVGTGLAVLTEVVRLAEDNHTAEQEKNRCAYKHRFNVLVGVVAARERITSLQGHDVDESPAKD